MERAGYRIVRAGEDTRGLGLLLPRGVCAVEAIGAVAPDALFAREAEAIANAVEVRRLEFARGRSCARRALVELGVEPDAIPSGADRAPVWPPAIVGSITHCRDYCAAALGMATRWSTIGIDAEILKPIAAGIQHMILAPAEQAMLGALDPAIPWATVVFSAKEALFKAWYPRARRWLEFLEVEVRLDAGGHFQAELLIAAPSIDWPRVVDGRFCIEDGRVMASVILQPP